jgi:hypothetical protein
MSGARHRQKGNRIEREIVDRHLDRAALLTRGRR